MEICTKRQWDINMLNYVVKNNLQYEMNVI